MARSHFFLIFFCCLAAVSAQSEFDDENPIRLVSDGFDFDFDFDFDFANTVKQIVGDTRHAVAFARFAYKYGKKYETAEEIKMRFENFVKSLESVKETNKKGLSYTVAINEFSDMSWEEFRAKRLAREPQNCSAHSSGIRMLKQIIPPASKDWRKAGIIGPVKDQGSCGSCWAFSATGAVEAAYTQAFGYNVSLSEQQLVDCSGGFQNKGCNGGLPSRTFEYIKYNGGIESDISYPYTAKDGKCQFNKDNVVAEVLGSYNITTGDEDEMKFAVGLIQPVSVCFQVVDDFYGYKSGIYSSSKCRSSPPWHINHAVLAVGYGVERGVPYWILKNSWGESWGDHGYFKMLRGKNMCGIGTCASFPVLKTPQGEVSAIGVGVTI